MPASMPNAAEAFPRRAVKHSVITFHMLSSLLNTNHKYQCKEGFGAKLREPDQICGSVSKMMLEFLRNFKCQARCSGSWQALCPNRPGIYLYLIGGMAYVNTNLAWSAGLARRPQCRFDLYLQQKFDLN
jgi:hypothetical protein